MLTKTLRQASLVCLFEILLLILGCGFVGEVPLNAKP